MNEYTFFVHYANNVSIIQDVIRNHIIFLQTRKTERKKPRVFLFVCAVTGVKITALAVMDFMI